MFPLRCSVRGCTHLLEKNERGLTCKSGHHFDQAKQGYWNLLQPQDRKSLSPGDNDDAVLARHRWLERGHGSGLIQALKPWVRRSLRDESFILDLGCGEGTFGAALFGETPDQFCGVDLSKRAIKLAARQWPDATWVLANADRTLPVADQTMDCVVSLFGRRPIGEIHRVLAPGGECIVAVPGEEDLIELRETVQQSGHRRNRWESIVSEFASAGLESVEHSLWSEKIALDANAIADALDMTYRAVRNSQRERRDSLSEMTVTMSADLLLFRRA